MNKLNLASKGELNPFWVFLPHFFAEGDVYLWAVLSLREMMGYFLACSLGTAQIQGRIPPTVQVKSFTRQGAEEDLQGPPCENQKEWTLTWDEDLLSLPPVLSMS